MNLRIWSKLEKNVPEKLLIRIAFVTDIYRLDTETIQNPVKQLRWNI